MTACQTIDDVSQILMLATDTLPQTPDSLWSDGIPLGAVYVPFATPVESVAVLRRAPIRCAHCGAVINLHCTVDHSTGRWQCSLCSGDNEHMQLCDVDHANVFPELHSALVEYVDPQQQPPALQPAAAEGGSVQRTDSAATPLRIADVQPLIFVVDGTLDQSNMQRLSDYLESATEQLGASVPVALLVYSNVVALYDLSLTDMAAAHTYPAADSLVLRELASSETRQRFVQAWHTARASVRTVLHTLVDAALPPALAARDSVRQRALGPALDIAVQLAEARRGDGAPRVGCRIVVLAAGAPNYGPGSVPESTRSGGSDDESSHAAAALFLGAVGRRAAACDTRVDVLACGARQLAIPLLQSVVMPTGGRVVLHRDVDEQCAANLDALLAERATSGVDGVFDVWCSATPALEAVRVIGPAAHDEQPPAVRGNMCHCRLAAVRPDASFCVYFELSSGVRVPCVSLQWTSLHTAPDNSRRLRVLTRQFATSNEARRCVDGVNSDVVALLLAKREVLLARKAADPQAAARNVDATMRRIVLDCAPSRGTQRVLPEALQPLLPLMFALSNGALLGPQLQHIDDTDHERGRLLTAAPRDAALLIAPRLFVVERGGGTHDADDGTAADDAGSGGAYTLRGVAAADVALWHNRVLLFDAGGAIYVWCGRDSGGRVGELGVAGLAMARARAAQRVPRPFVSAFDEGDSMARLLQCRLYPLHKDPLAEQLAQFPDLQQLPDAELKALLDGLFYTDAESLSMYTQRMTRR